MFDKELFLSATAAKRQCNKAVDATALLSMAYFAPVQWYQKLFRYSRVEIESCENFVKQSYRNRCVIATADGTQALTIPVERGVLDAQGKCSVRDIRISDHGDWRRLHWNAIASAYGYSPFFEYYEDDIRPFFNEPYDSLLNYNLAITNKVCELLGVDRSVKVTTDYMPAYENGAIFPEENGENGVLEGHERRPDVHDYRNAIRPKHPAEDPLFEPRPYHQVFAQRNGFTANLSILDLLFNEGPESILWL